jgi:hypothetical protein
MELCDLRVAGEATFVCFVVRKNLFFPFDEAWVEVTDDFVGGFDADVILCIP